MTEIRPFRGLRYNPRLVQGDDVIAPPYDVVGADAVAELQARSPYNAAHIENPAGEEPERYTAAAQTIEGWLRDGALVRDARPAYYVYEQRARIEGRHRSRRCFFARTRLHRPDEGIVRPHEATMSGPREERLKLLRATRTNISPVFGMFVDESHRARDLLARVAGRDPDFEARDALRDRHRLWNVTDRREIEELTAAVAASNITIADGHHRTHTALDYRDECAAKARRWTGDEPENFVLMGLIPEDEPGLVILPIHRLLKSDPPPDGFFERLGALYRVETIAAEGDNEVVREAWNRVQANALGPTTFGVLGATGPRSIHLAVARSQHAIDAAMPQGLSPASRRLDPLILTETVLSPIFGIDHDVLTAGERVEFSEDLQETRTAVERGDVQLAFLVNPVRVEQVRQVADAGEVMPQKATYFYPKLATGMVFNRLDD